MKDLTQLRRQLGSTGLFVSPIGFGASGLGGVFESIDEDEGIAAVRLAFELGINFFDTSPYYGDTRSEKVLGRALSFLPRREVVVCSKVGRYGPSDFDFSAERVTRSVHESLERLGLDYLDLVQCHDIEFGDLAQISRETLPALAILKSKGKIRHIGITGLPLAIFRAILERAEIGHVEVCLSYCHLCLNDRTLERLLPYLRERQGLGVINASPLSMGLLSTEGPPQWHPAPRELREKCQQAAAYCTARGVDLSTIALQFSVSHPGIDSTLIGMFTCDHVRRNVAAAASALTPVHEGSGHVPDPAILAGVTEILQPVMGLSWPSGRPENNFIINGD